MTYKEKLLDPRWQKKRLEILARDGFACALCHDPHSTLHIHHERYIGEPWEALDCDLITYCKYCHSAAEHIKKCFKNYNILRAWKGVGSPGRDHMLFIVIGFCEKPEVQRKVLIYELKADQSYFIAELEPYLVFRLHELTMEGTYSQEEKVYNG